MKINTLIYIMILGTCLIQFSCKKFLDAKPSSNYSTVSSIDDAQLLVDNSSLMNVQAPQTLGESSADNYYITNATFDSYDGVNSNRGQIYTWGQYPFLYLTSSVTSWSAIYSAIMVANTALDALNKIKPDAENSASYNNAKGCALAFRGYYFWNLATTFAQTYKEETAGSDLGIPLRVNININETSIRGNLQQTYDQIIRDLTEAALLLPDKPTVMTRPSKASVYAILANVYLSMRKYDLAQKYADSSLAIKNGLIDYNTLDASSKVPIPAPTINPEILIYFGGNGTTFAYSSRYMIVDSTLYLSYSDKDLRKKIFYLANADSTLYFPGVYGYNGKNIFTGPTTAEMYLTRAECSARKGDVNDAMKDLNALLINRIAHTSSELFVPYTAASSTEALTLILAERRKELAFRDRRWMDLKRFNADGANITLIRNISGKTYTLLPNVHRYALQLPLDVIQLSGMPQNPYP